MSAFEKIAAGLADAIAYAEGDKTKGRIAAGPDVKAIRTKTKLTQAQFANRLRISAATVRDWEQHRRTPDAPAQTLLRMIATDPEGALALIDRSAA